ncbi:MAG: hypothetical protein AB9891_01455 [Anaerolineaceae bacterium]
MQILKRSSPLLPVLFFAAVFRVAWKLYTGYTFEDAFITFRYARNLADGLGFVYNAGEHVLGTTTPLFSLLMAGWIKLFPNFVVPGAATFGLLAGLTSIFLVWKILGELQIDDGQKILITGLLAASDKFWSRDMGGMETPLVICAMMASFYLLLRHKPAWAGVFAEILLWLRIDGLPWVILMAASAWVISRCLPLKFLVTAAAIYLPWLVFSFFYFGSLVPHTIFAKSVAYAAGMPPIWDRAGALMRWLTPFSLPYLDLTVVKWAAVVTLAVSTMGIIAIRRQKWLLLLPAFCLEEAARLIVMGATFESRYFVPLIWALLILFGFGLSSACGFLSARIKFHRLIGYSLVAIYLGTSLWFAFQQALSNQETQYFVYESSLKNMGIWLDKNTPPDSSVLLEPLGYVGFHANRRMIDEVGLVSPQVVALKKQGYDTFGLVNSLNPDYVVLHCDDGMRASVSFLSLYARAAEFNPMGFNPYESGINGRDTLNRKQIRNPANPRAACYQIWRRIKAKAADRDEYSGFDPFHIQKKISLMVELNPEKTTR